MATILYAWEFGGGLGHVARMQPLAAELTAAGHRIVIAARDVPLASQFFGELPIMVLQAPLGSLPNERIRIAYSFSHVLFNCGFGEYDALFTATKTWRTLFEQVRPDMLLADYSPIALLAARGSQIKVVSLGTGFECPPNQSPLPSIRPGPSPDLHDMQRIEDEMLACINAVASALKFPPLNRVADLYHDRAHVLLLTYPELDPYTRPDDAAYCGAHAYSPGKAPIWPSAPGKRVFVYLKPSRYLEQLLGTIAALRLPTIAYVGPSTEIKQKFYEKHIQIEEELIAHEAITEECDLAITNGGHLLTATLLLAGKPMVIVPQSLEQCLNAIKVKAVGAGEWVHESNAVNLPTIITRLIADAAYVAAANAFAAKYQSFRGQQSLRCCLEYIERALAANRIA